MSRFKGVFIAWGIIILIGTGMGCTVTYVRSGASSYLDMEGTPHISRQTDSEISNGKLESIEKQVEHIGDNVQETNQTVEKVNVRIKDVKENVEENKQTIEKVNVRVKDVKENVEVTKDSLIKKIQ